jgi:hypothetical protein
LREYLKRPAWCPVAEDSKVNEVNAVSFGTNGHFTLSDFLSFFSFSRTDTSLWSVLSSTSLSGVDRDIVTSAVRSTGLDSSAASNCHFADSFTDLAIS